MSRRLLQFGSKFGTCNICGTDGPLTNDHTPPKGCVRPTVVQVKALIDAVALDANEKTVVARSSNGVKYRTICSDCNNRKLGGNYDKALIRFTNAVAEIVSSPLALPSTVSIEIEPQKVMRAVFGHIAAVGVNRYQKGPHTEYLRDWFSSGMGPLPGTWKLFCWLYPNRTQILARDWAALDIDSDLPREQRIFPMWFMKFFPLGFMFTMNQTPGLCLRGLAANAKGWVNLTELTDFGSLPPNSVATVNLSIRPAIHVEWPQKAAEGWIIAAHGSSSIQASEWVALLK